MEKSSDFDVQDANWVCVQRLGSQYEEELDVSRKDGKRRHRPIVSGDQPKLNWVDGKSPD